MTASQNIKKLRLSLGLEQSEFCKEFKVTSGTICNWECGRRKPRLIHVRKMVELAKRNKVKVSIEDFIA
jgi:DNA-binding transcriptional regulator YiaG